jgi:hypothetical protein
MAATTPEGLGTECTTNYRLGEEYRAAVLEMESCDQTYTPAQVERWKELGLTQPKWIKQIDWAIGAMLNPRQLMICKCSALMMGPAEVSELTGMSPAYISRVTASEAGRLEIASIQDKFLSNTKKMLDDILPLAIKTAFHVMLDPKTKPQVKADAAFRFMDRVMGRPVQQIEMNDNLIRQVYEKLDANKVVDIATKRIENAVIVAEATQETETQTPELDPVDSWVKENL